MNLQADLKWIHEELDKVKDPNLIEAIKKLLQYRRQVESERIGLDQYNKEIEASIAEIRGGKTYTQEEMQERIKQWGKQ